MAAAAILLRVSAGLTGVGCLLFLAKRNEESRFLHALSYGRQVFDREKTTKWDRNWDNRAPSKNTDGADDKDSNSSVTTGRSKAKRHLIFIRHGQYVHAEEAEKKVLTELGRRQAAATGRRLKQLSLPYSVIHYSTMVRATETALIISKSLPGVPTKTSDMLREGAPMEPEPPSTHWRPEHHEFFQDGARIEAAFRHFFHRASPDQKEDSTEVIVCHANVIRYFVCRALQLPPEAWLRMSIANCGITRLTIRPNGMVSLQALGDSGHLPPDMITFN